MGLVAWLCSDEAPWFGLSRRKIAMSVLTLSARRRHLASFENAYAVAVQLRETTGARQFVVRTANPLQPFRVSDLRPCGTETVLALVA